MDYRKHISGEPKDVASKIVTIPEPVSKKVVGLGVIGCVSYLASFGMQPRQTFFAFRLLGHPSSTEKPQSISAQYMFARVEGIEVGTTVPVKNVGRMSDMVARNDAD